jgi:signal transduction histidine kinase
MRGGRIFSKYFIGKLHNQAEGKLVQYFLAGIVVILIITVPVFWIFLRKKHLEIQKINNMYVKQLEESGKLTGQLAHEIKNPLSTIKVNLKLIEEDLETFEKEKLKENNQRIVSGTFRKIGIVEKEADRLEQILDGFLRYTAQAELELFRTDINELMSDMIDFFSPKAHSHSVTIRQGLWNEPLYCKLDVDTFKQVILNLFINAQQAMPKGGELIIRTSKDNAEALIEISDTGVGIPQEKLTDIFKAYYSSSPEGMGLGLVTARKIIEAHKGTISVESEPGKGTSFTIRLPINNK